MKWVAAELARAGWPACGSTSASFLPAGQPHPARKTCRLEHTGGRMSSHGCATCGRTAISAASSWRATAKGAGRPPTPGTSASTGWCCWRRRAVPWAMSCASSWRASCRPISNPKPSASWQRSNVARTAADVPPALLPLYRPSVQPYLISSLRLNPSDMLRRARVSVMLVQGDADLQVSGGRLRSAEGGQAGRAGAEGQRHEPCAEAGPAATWLRNPKSYRSPDWPFAPGQVPKMAGARQGPFRRLTLEAGAAWQPGPRSGPHAFVPMAVFSARMSSSGAPGPRGRQRPAKVWRTAGRTAC